MPTVLSQFVYGPLSDRYGRRPLTLAGLGIFCYGALLSTFSHHFATLVLGSSIQGLGIGVAGVMSRTIARDIYRGRRLRVSTSHISVATIFAPLIAPLLGGVIAHSLGWRAVFACLALFSAVVFCLQYRFFPETNRAKDKNKNGLKQAFVNYKQLIHHRAFLGNVICLLAAFGGIAVFESCGGILFSKLFHYGPIGVSVLFIIPLPAYMLGCHLAGRLSQRFSPNQLMSAGIYFLLAGGLSMLVSGILHQLSLCLILIPASLFLFGTGLLYPTATSAGLEPFPHMAGTAGAMLGAVQNLGAGLCTLVPALITQHSQLPLGCILTALAALVTSTYYLTLRSKPRRAVLQGS